MNLTYIRGYLDRIKDSATSEDIKALIKDIDDYQGTESSFTDIARTMRTINEYNLNFLTKVQEFEIIATGDMKLLPRRVEKAREILCILSALHTYLVLSTYNIKESNFNMKNLRTYMTELNDKKEHFRSEKMTWAAVLKSLSQEMAYTSEMRRMDIEDKVGYLKYKES